MKKTRYKFNTRTLEYDKIDITFKEKLKRFMFNHFPVSVFIAAALVFIFSFVIDTKEETRYRRDNKKLKKQYNVLSKQFNDIIDVSQEVKKSDDTIYHALNQVDAVPKEKVSVEAKKKEQSRLFSFENDLATVENTSQRLGNILEQLDIQNDFSKEILYLAYLQKDNLRNIPALCPINNPNAYISAYFEIRYHPILKRKKMHDGIDFAVAIGTEVIAPGDGKVIETRYSGGYGLQITIDHGNGFVTKYAHLDKIKVSKYQKVSRGEVIGLVGNSGLSNSPHLHYEVHYKEHKINPLKLYFHDIDPDEFDHMLAVSAKSKHKH